ncbi:MAG: hypothetical protein IJY98_05580 [Bacteroidaceae bacterium]|nr:hypothetical protein [Bacteroidales bacterium]MBO5262692.1 hypothetical protein [Bacteroidaceae bacterium]MBQ8257370.1 hypothetical protein [Bacteroidaceae bacterium]
MRLFRNPNITIAILAVYTIIVYAYLFPRNQEMTTTEKWITVGSSCFILAVLWYLLRKRDKLRKEREKDIENKK